MNHQNKNLKYIFYATLLDKFQSYISSSDIYQEYWGFSENPEFTEEEFHEKQRLSLIDTINRVPFESDAADKGTVFNEIVDCLILNKKSSKMEISSDCETGLITATYKNKYFIFPISLCVEFSNYYKGAIPQVRTEAVLETSRGNVLLYGDIDELMPVSIHDIKTTKKYSVGKFKRNWQHKVYPYCLNNNGCNISEFEYNIAVINETKKGISYETFTEYYAYNQERDIQLLRNHVENLIDFIESNRDLIIDKKIFNQHL